jgi:L-lactate dehydrogenase (cytochrome)
MNVSHQTTTRRRIPRWRHLRPLLQIAPVDLPSVERRLSRARTIGDLRELARRRAPRAVFDYTDGAAENEISLARARRTFREIEFHPTVLRDVAKVDLSRKILGRTSALPFMFAPAGFTRMVHHEGEVAVSRVAERVGIPYALSTLARRVIAGPGD